MNLIQSTILTSLPAGKKKTPSGWISFNAPCCVYQGEGADKRKRGGVMTSPDGTLSYHCFNCGYKTSYVVGRKLNAKMRQLMSWLGLSTEQIRKLSLEAMRHQEDTDNIIQNKKIIDFTNKTLPKNSFRIEHWLEKYLKKDLTDKQHEKIDMLLNYLNGRNIQPHWYNFMYSPDQIGDFDVRLLIPFYWKGNIVGYTGRLFDNNSKKVKYWTEVQPGYVFNIDAQDWKRKFVIVTEGPFDALSLSGVSILGSEINQTQKEIIDNLARQVIVVPDRDKAGTKLIDQAMEFGWSVSFPQWEPDVKDPADAVSKYGRLFTMKSILDSTKTSKLQIDLSRKINA